MAPLQPTPRTAWRDGVPSPGQRMLAEETAIAITYNRITHAVMMATPADLEDFAVGFSLSENIVASAADIESCEIIEIGESLELRLWIAAHHMEQLEKRRRRLAGATGCGMCGLESLEQAMRPMPVVPRGADFTAAQIHQAIASLSGAQKLNQQTHAVHAAGFWAPAQGLVALREDVGRHNALDKLAGALAKASVDPASGILLLTSRISIELVQKAARLGAALIVAISAPTALAVRAAESAGITLVGVARADGFEIFTHPTSIIA